jgi:putative ABC transport system permease protein
MEILFTDIRYGLRNLLKHPGFTAMVVVTLALGIGANTAIFSLVNAFLLRPLPYQNPDQLFWISEVSPQQKDEMIPAAHFLEWAEQSHALEKIAVYSERNLALTNAGDPERLDGGAVSAAFFPMLAVQPFLGRVFLPTEDRLGGDRVVVISHRLWQRRFSADRNIVGESVTLDDRSYTVVGVLPPDFRFFQPLDLWIPLALDPQQERGNQMISKVSALARLTPGIPPEQAQSELEAIRVRYETNKPVDNPRFSGQVRLVSLHERFVGNTHQLVLILLGAVSLILLIACANVANLQLSRAIARQKELAIRAGLGAGRLRLIRQMLTESLLLAAAGGVLGLLVAVWITAGLVALAATNTFGDITHLASINIDLRVLAFTFLISVMTGVLFGLVPALQISKPNLNDLLKEGWRLSGFHRSRLRQALMVTEISLAIMLLVGAGLLVRSFVNLLAVHPGFKAQNLLTARLSLPYPRYQDRAQRQQFVEQLLPRISTLPGVESAAVVNHLPLTDFVFSGALRVEGQDPLKGKVVPISQITSDYFRTMDIPLRKGRIFTARDNADAPKVVIVNETLAQSLFPSHDPIGRQVWIPSPGKGLPTIIGVVGDVRHGGLDQDVKPEVYIPYMQNPSGTISLAIKSKVDPLTLTGAVRKQVLEVDSSLPIFEVMTMDQRLSQSFAPRRFNLLLLGSFALLALALAALGVYSVMAYGAGQRIHEIGIRMALGAQGTDVLKMLMGQGMSLVALGLVLGLAGAFVLTRVMASLLFGVTARDPITFTLVGLLLATVAFIASYIPARRATKVDPLVALRYE